VERGGKKGNEKPLEKRRHCGAGKYRQKAEKTVKYLLYKDGKKNQSDYLSTIHLFARASSKLTCEIKKFSKEVKKWKTT